MSSSFIHVVACDSISFLRLNNILFYSIPFSLSLSLSSLSLSVCVCVCVCVSRNFWGMSTTVQCLWQLNSYKDGRGGGLTPPPAGEGCPAPTGTAEQWHSRTQGLSPRRHVSWCFHSTLLICWGHSSRYWCVGSRCRKWNSFLGFRRKGCKDRNLCPQSLLFCPVEGGMMSYVFLVTESTAKKRQAWGPSPY